MKKILFLLLSVLTLFVVSCSKQDKDEVTLEKERVEDSKKNGYVIKYYKNPAMKPFRYFILGSDGKAYIRQISDEVASITKNIKESDLEVDFRRKGRVYSEIYIAPQVVYNDYFVRLGLKSVDRNLHEDLLNKEILLPVDKNKIYTIDMNKSFWIQDLEYKLNSMITVESTVFNPSIRHGEEKDFVFIKDKGKNLAYFIM